MSSHHIVKEGQEPALIIANGEVCSNKLLGELLEWSPYIVVLDGALDRVLSLGIHFDILLGDFDNQSIEELTKRVPPQTQIIHTPNQDKTDLEKAIEFLVEKKLEAVNIVWATGRRSDHSLNNIGIMARYWKQIKMVMLDNYSRIYPISNGFKKHFNKGDNLSLMPLNTVKNITTSNLVWNLRNQILEFPYSTSSSNKVLDTDFVEITFSEGFLLAMECYDSKNE
jgi:thiamine pyrophosphokinase